METFEEQLEVGKLVVYGSVAALTAVTGVHTEKAARLDLEAHGKYICSVLKEPSPFWAEFRPDVIVERCMFVANDVNIVWISPASWAVLLMTEDELMAENTKETTNGLVAEMMGVTL